MKITIIGIGAMGSLFAARLARLAGITMLGSWEAQLRALNSEGLTLVHPDGSQSRHPIHAMNNTDEIPAADLVLIMVKTPKTAAAARAAAAVLKPDGLVITLQNGLGNLETVAEIVGPERACQGITSEGAAMLGPGVVRHAGAGKTYIAEKNLGTEIANESRKAKLKAATLLFEKAGFDTKLVENADSLIWGKLAVNAGINPLTALLQVPNGFLLENEDAKWLMSQAAEEVATVAKALAIPLPYPDAGQQAAQVAKDTAANRSSMAQDVARGVPTEIERICGEVVRFGRQLGISTPINQSLYDLVEIQTATGSWQEEIKYQPLAVRERLLRLTKQ